MKLTKRERKTLRSALRRAIDWTDSLIDAHRTTYARRSKNGMPYMIIGPVDRPYCERLARQVANYQKLLARLEVAEVGK